MSGFNWTTTGDGGLIDAVQIRCMMPLTQDTFTDQRILSLADQELQTLIAPMIMAVDGNYFVTENFQAMTTETVYPIPSDAIGLGVKSVWWINPQNQRYLIPEINDQSAQNNWAGMPYFTGYFLQNNSVVLYPAASNNATLMIKYFRRAPKMILTTDAGQITAVDTLNSTITLDNLPTTWAVNDTVDCIEEEPGFLTLATARTITNIASNTLTLDDVSNMSVGNWVALENESPIPQINPEAHTILAQAIATRCLESLSDAKSAVAKATLKDLMDAFIKNMTPRTKTQARKVVSVDGGILGWSTIWPWPWWGGF